MLNRISPNMYKNHITPWFILLVVTLIFFWPLLIGSNWHIPYGGGDLESFTWPTYQFTSESIKSGNLPLWNPYLHSGAPHAADNQSGLFYPPNILLSLLPKVSYTAMEWMVAVHIFFAGLGMYYASHKYHQSKSIYPSILAAIAFQFSSLFITHIGNLNIIASASYLPWVWLSTTNLFRSLAYKDASITSIILTLSILSGHAQMSLIVALAILVYSIYQLTIANNKIKLLTLLIYTTLLTAGLTAFYIAPSIEMSAYTNRINYTYENSTSYSIPPEGLIELITPILFGRGPKYFWPGWDRVELGYTGLITLILSCLGLFYKKKIIPLVLVGLIGILMSLGDATPIHKLAFLYLPGFSLLRVPARFILLTNFSISMLASLGLHYWQSQNFKVKHLNFTLLSISLVTIIILPLTWTITSNKYEGGHISNLTISITVALITIILVRLVNHKIIVILLAVEMLALGSWIEVDYRNPENGYRSGPALEYLKSQPPPYRIDIASSRWQPNYGLMNRIESINGLHNPLTLSHYDKYYWSVNYRGSPQYNFLNAKYLITDKNNPAADSSFVPIYTEDPMVDIYLNTNSHPRITLKYSSINTKDNSEAFTQIHSPNFNSKTEVVIVNGKNINSPAPPNTELTYLSYNAIEYKIKVITPTEGYLVFSEVWYPGWSTTINGLPVETLRANYAFRAIHIPPGKHIVHSKFTPKVWSTSLMFSQASLILVVAHLFYSAIYIINNKSDEIHK